MGTIQCVRSTLLTDIGIKHGWFMRFGGVSTGLFESLNGKKGNGDLDVNVDENRRRACQHLGLDANNLTHIIHEFKTNILESDQIGEHTGFDASISTEPGQVLSQTTADCGTVIIANISGSVVAVVHGSWHTLKENIIHDVVAKLKTHTDETLVAGLGPMICSQCYEFGAEAKELFPKRYLRTKKQKYLVDLKQMIIDQLQESGVTKIDDIGICTLEDDRFFSHRRSGANSGRLITLASL